MLTAYFGKHYEFSFTAPAPTNATREFDSFWDAAKEAGMSRIYGGIHFSFANKDGLELGEDVAEWVLDSFAAELVGKRRSAHRHRIRRRRFMGLTGGT